MVSTLLTVFGDLLASRNFTFCTCSLVIATSRLSPRAGSKCTVRID